jgi:acyl-CoA thioesterase
MADLMKFFERDRYALLSDVSLKEVKPGYARAVMTIADKHRNGVDVAQGGSIFTLADLAFAAACNSHGTVAVAINVSISFLKAATGGTLTAEAREISKSARLSSVTVEVRDDTGDLVAHFQGMAFRKNETIDEFLAKAGAAAPAR